MWRSLGRWVSRRGPRVDPGEEAFGYAGAVSSFIYAMLAISLIEIPAVHFLLPWRTARLILLPIGVFGLVSLLGMVAALKVNPHTLGPAGLRLRHGTGFALPLVAWRDIVAIRTRLHCPSGRGVHIENLDGRDVLAVEVGSQTNVEATLRRATPVSLRRGTRDVEALRFWADDATALVERAREHLADSKASDDV